MTSRRCILVASLTLALGCQSGPAPTYTPHPIQSQPVHYPTYSDSIPRASKNHATPVIQSSSGIEAASAPAAVESPEPVTVQSATVVPVESETARRLALEEAVRTALQGSPLLVQRTEAVYEAEARLREMQNLFGPRLQFDYLSHPWRAAVPERLGADDIPNVGTNRVSMTLFVPVVNARNSRDAAVRQALEEVKVRKAMVDLARNDTVTSVIKEYMGAVKAAQLSTLATEAVELNRERMRIVENLRERKLIMSDRVLLGQKMLCAAQEEETYRSQDAQLRMRKLASLLGLPRDTRLELVEPTMNLSEPPTLADLRQTLATYNPVLMRILHERESAYWTGRLRQYEEPRAHMFLTYGADFPYFEEISDDFLLTGVSINWPTAKVRLDRAKRDQTYHRIRQLELEQEIVSSQLLNSLEETYAAYLKMLKRLEVKRLDVSLAVENVRLSQLFREHGATDTQEPEDVFQLTVNRIAVAEAKAELARTEVEAAGLLADLYQRTGACEQVLNQFTAPVQETRTPENLGMWVWKSEAVLTGDGLADLLAFADRRQVGEIYLYLGSVEGKSYTEVYADELQDVVARCHAKGVAVHGLMGEPDWVTEAGAGDYRKHLDSFIAYNRTCKPEGRFDALHLDIEPHTLPEWKTDRWPELAQAYLTLLRDTRFTLLQEFESKRMPLVIDISPAYERMYLSLEKPTLATQALEISDEVVVMAYRTDAGKAFAEAGPILESGRRLKRAVRIGLDAAESGEAGTTFAGADPGRMRAVMMELERRGRTEPAFAGISVHDWEGFAALCGKSVVE